MSDGDILSDVIDAVSSVDLSSLTDIIHVAGGVITAFGVVGRIVNLSAPKRAVSPRRIVNQRSDTANGRPSANALGPREHGDRPCEETSGVYAILDCDGVHTPSDDTKVAVAGAWRALEKMPAAARTWAEVMAALTMCPLLIPCAEYDLNKVLQLEIQDADWVKSRVVSEAITRKFQEWLGNLLQPVKFDMDNDGAASLIVLARTMIEQLALHKGERKYRKFVDLTVVAYPNGDSNAATFRVHRVELYVWRRAPIGNDNAPRTGFEGFFTERVFRPRESVIAGMQDASRKNAIKIANSVFSGEGLDCTRSTRTRCSEY